MTSRPHVGRRAARMLAAAALVVTPVLALAPGAFAVAPVDTGWWNFAAREGLPQPPSPPDVMEGDLLVQAGDPSGLAGGRTDAMPAPSAVAALRFAVPDGSTLGPLTLTIAMGGTAMDVRAYATTDPWTSEYGAPLSQAPAPDPTSFSVGVPAADGVHLVFADISRVAPETGPLSIVLLPGATDRVVIKKPDATALTVRSGTSTTPPAPPPATTGSNAAPPDFQSAPSTDTGGAQTFGAGPVGSGGFDSGPTSIDSGPVVAAPAPDPAIAPNPATQPTAPQAAAPQAVRPVSSVVPGLSDARTRYFAVAEALLVLVTFGLLGWGPFARLAELTGNASGEPQARPRGVGRFTADRDGRPAKL